MNPLDRNYPKGFDIEAHNKHIEAGYCGSLNFKIYCSGRANHSGPHFASKIYPPNAKNSKKWQPTMEWN